MWLFGDVIFAVLPIVTIAFINTLLGSRPDSLFLIKEWSFATIVFFGVSIRKLIRLKIQIQHVPKSYKLDTGVQFYIVLLIASVLVLSFVILGEKGVIPQHEADLLSKSQLALFFLGLLSVFLAVVTEERLDVDTLSLPREISKQWLFRRLISKVEHATSCLDYVISATKQASTMEFSDPENQISQEVEEERLHVTLQNAIDSLESALSRSKEQLESLKALRAIGASGKA
jgi:hypothetical protein